MTYLPNFTFQEPYRVLLVKLYGNKLFELAEYIDTNTLNHIVIKTFNNYVAIYFIATKLPETKPSFYDKFMPKDAYQYYIAPYCNFITTTASSSLNVKKLCGNKQLAPTIEELTEILGFNFSSIEHYNSDDIKLPHTIYSYSKFKQFYINLENQ